GPEKRLVALVVEADDVDVNRDEPLFHDGACVGYVTSGGYAHTTGHSVALGYVPSALARDDAVFEIEILGERRPARLQPRPLYDPEGARMRG
ncbi:MAG: glycine cleavage T C-terminal barrel domain-containing protein, partial [Kiloniellales bacterium]|nr:glycine cleavage T C-terminal barrel domain-containing protein [Kiloniellales bacterium]